MSTENAKIHATESKNAQNEKQLEKAVDKSTLEITEKYNLSPVDTKKVRGLIHQLKNEKVHSHRLSSITQDIPEELLRSTEMQSIVEESLFRTITDDPTDSIGIPYQYVKTFGIQPEFFADKRFDSYRKKEWLDDIKTGRTIDFTTGYVHSYRWRSDEDGEEERTDKILSGTIFDAKKLFSEDELKWAALKGIVGHFASEKEDDVKLVDSYMQGFGISSETMRNFALQYAKDNILTIPSAIEKKYPEVKSLYNSPDGQSLAKKAIEKQIINGREVTEAIEKFGFDKNEFNTESMYHRTIESLVVPDASDRHSAASFFQKVKKIEEVFGDTVYEKIRAKIMATSPENLAGFFENVFQYVGDFWETESDVFQKLNFPKELLRDCAFSKIIMLGKHNDFYTNTIEKDKKNFELYGLTDDIKKEALSVVFFRQGLKSHDLSSDRVQYLKDRIGLDSLVFSPRVLEALKSDYIELVEKGDMYLIGKVDEFLKNESQSIPWNQNDKPARKEAVIKGLAQVCGRGEKAIDAFLKEQYPETHHIFLGTDPTAQEIVKTKLIELAKTSIWGNTEIDKKNMNDAIAYFSLDRTVIFEAVDEVFGFLHEDKARRLKSIFPEANPEQHNALWAEKEGEKAFVEALESSQFDLLRIYRTSSKMEQLLKKEIVRQEQLLSDVSTSPSLQKFAGEFLKFFFWDSSFAEGLKDEDKEVIERLQAHTKGNFVQKIAQFDITKRGEFYKEYIDEFNKNVATVAQNKSLDILDKDEYQIVVEEVYPKRNYDTYEFMQQYEDRSSDLDKYSFDKNGYDIRLSGVLGYQVKQGSIEDARIIGEFSERIDAIKNLATEQNLREFLTMSITDSKAQTIEGKILEYFKEKGYSVDTMNVLLAYQLLGQYDDFIAGSTDRVREEETQVSKNFILLDELVNRYGDTMKETIKSVQKVVVESEDRDLFVSSANEKFEGKYAELSETIMNDLSRVPREKIKNETIQKKIARTLKNTFQGVGVVQERAEYFAGLFTVNDLDSFSESWIRHFDELFAVEGEYMLDVSKIEGLQSNVYQKLQSEISKYEEIKEVDDSRGEEKLKKERTIKGYFSKNKENAHARMVGDICIAKDPTMLKNEKYFEFVLFDEERAKCVGTTMLLEMSEDEEGKKYLLYCPNPAVGLVSEVSAKKLYKKMTDQIAQFAKENNFDAVLVDKTHGKSTNRAGLFQQTLEQSCLKSPDGREITLNLKNKYTLGSSYTYQQNLKPVWMK